MVVGQPVMDSESGRWALQICRDWASAAHACRSAAFSPVAKTELRVVTGWWVACTWRRRERGVGTATFQDNHAGVIEDMRPCQL